MSKWDRWAAGTGIIFVALFVAGYFVAGKPPTLSDGNAKWVRFFHDHSKEVKASSMLFGLAIVAFLWFAAAVATRLREAGEQRLGATVLGGAAATAGAFLVAAGTQASVAFRIAPESPAQVKPFVVLFYTIGILVGFSVAVVIGAASIAALRGGVFPRWFGFAGAVSRGRPWSSAAVRWRTTASTPRTAVTRSSPPRRLSFGRS